MLGKVFKRLDDLRQGSSFANLYGQFHPSYLEFFCPVSKAHGTSLVGQTYRIPSVFALFLLCRPSAIFWFVVSVIINAFYRVFEGRSFTHVSKKVFKGLPFGTNSNAPAVVMLSHFLLRFGIRWSATMPHGNPSPIFFSPSCYSSLRFSAGVSMRPTKPSRPAFNFQTPATFRVSGYERVRSAFRCFSTITNTGPKRTLSFTSVRPNDDQSPEALTFSINEWWHVFPFKNNGSCPTHSLYGETKC